MDKFPQTTEYYFTVSLSMILLQSFNVNNPDAQSFLVEETSEGDIISVLLNSEANPTPYLGLLLTKPLNFKFIISY